MNESYHTYELVISHVWMSHVTYVNESCQTYTWVISHVWMSHITQVNASHHKHKWVVLHVWMNHIYRCICIIIHLCTSMYIGDHHWSSFWFSNKQHYLSTSMYIYIHMYAYMYINVYLYTHTHAGYTDTHTHARRRQRAHLCTHTLIQIHTHTHTHTHINTHTHRRIHTHTNTHTYTHKHTWTGARANQQIWWNQFRNLSASKCFESFCHLACVVVVHLDESVCRYHTHTRTRSHTSPHTPGIHTGTCIYTHLLVRVDHHTNFESLESMVSAGHAADSSLVMSPMICISRSAMIYTHTHTCMCACVVCLRVSRCVCVRVHRSICVSHVSHKHYNTCNRDFSCSILDKFPSRCEAAAVSRGVTHSRSSLVSGVATCLSAKKDMSSQNSFYNGPVESR